MQKINIRFTLWRSVKGVDLPTFEVFDNRIARDKFNVYYLNRKIKKYRYKLLNI